MNEKQLMALVKKNAAKAAKAADAEKKGRPSYDPTLEATRSKSADETGESQRMFKEMKKREF